ncbi:MAG: IS3 family transposase [Candidatus Izemoplasmataceae bacterium]
MKKYTITSIISFNHLKDSIDEYIVFFNTQRPHASLKYNTPDEYKSISK